MDKIAKELLAVAKELTAARLEMTILDNRNKNMLRVRFIFPSSFTYSKTESVFKGILAKAEADLEEGSWKYSGLNQSAPNIVDVTFRKVGWDSDTVFKQLLKSTGARSV